MVLTATLSGGLPPSRAADPQPYQVELRPTGDAALDATIKDSAALISLKDKTPVGGFALVGRARDDASTFEAALRAFGYYDGAVRVTIAGIAIDDPALPDTIEKAPSSPPVRVVAVLTTGRRFHLGQITVEGSVPPGVRPDLGIARGQDALAVPVLAARDRLLAALREASYPLATVTLLPVVVHRDRAELDVTFQVSTGPRAALGDIRFNGLRDMSEAFMRERLLLHRGAPFSPSSIESAREDLLALGVFSSVRMVPAETLDLNGELPVLIDVEERKLHAVDFGAAWSTDLGASVSVGWHHRNLFGGAEQLNLTGAIQLGGNATTKPGYQLGAQFVKPGFLDRDNTLDVSLNAVKQSLLAYDQTALIERIGITRKLSDHWSIQVGVLGEEERIIQEGTTRDYNFVGLPVSVKYDTTKSLLDPTSGLRASASLTPVETFGAGSGTYLLTQLASSAYFDLRGNGRSVIAIRGLLGQASGVGVFGIPPDQRLYAGGSATVRGYRYQSIGPRFPDGKPTGGTAMSAWGVEYRQRFLENFAAVAFLDAGQASADGNPFSSNWHAGAGTGLRYYTPIGPIRLDVAVPLNRAHGDDAFELYIGIGQAF